LDQIDLEILNVLYKDARVPLKKIAADLGVSRETVLRRFKKLQEKGVVLGSTVILSSKALGFKEQVGFFVKTKSGTSISTIQNKLVSIPQITLVVPALGAYDFYVEGFLRDLEEMHDLIENIRRIEEIATIAPIVYSQQDWAIPYQLPLPIICP